MHGSDVLRPAHGSLGRKKLFIITLGVYLLATGATAFAFAPWYFYLARFFTRAGIGGEYAAINAAIDELIPARVPGRVDLMINGSYWLGSAAGAGAALFSWIRRSSPRTSAGGSPSDSASCSASRSCSSAAMSRSPRWLFIHGREEEAERIVRSIEGDVEDETDEPLDDAEESITVRQRKRIPLRTIASTAIRVYPKHTILGFLLFVGQAFIYNGVTFNLGTLFTTFYDVSSSSVPVFIVVFAVGNFLEPLTLGRLFDTWGASRRSRAPTSGRRPWRSCSPSCSSAGR